MEDVGLHTLSPAEGATKVRKRVGRGPGSGTGKRAGRGQKGQKSRSGHHYVPAGFEGGQMPLHMRIGKLRGSNKKMSMPMGPFRTQTSGVNVDSLARFEAGTEVTPELLVEAGLVRNLKHPIKILGRGDLAVKLTVSADACSASARQKIESAGGTITLLGDGIDPSILTHGRKPPKVKGVARDAGPAAAPKATSKPKAKAAAPVEGAPAPSESEAPVEDTTTGHDAEA